MKERMRTCAHEVLMLWMKTKTVGAVLLRHDLVCVVGKRVDDHWITHRANKMESMSMQEQKSVKKQATYANKLRLLVVMSVGTS